MAPFPRPGLAQCVFAAALSVAAAAAAQTPPDDSASYDAAPAHVSVVEGRATLERDGRVDQSPANVPLVAGDRLRTEDGRLEILFGDGSLLHVDHFTTLDLQSDSLLRLLQGRIRLTVAAGAPLRYRVDTPSASVRIEEAGDYRMSLLTPTRDDVDVELVVLRGAAELANESGATFVRAGERALTMGRGAPSYAQPYNVASWDAFERWVEDRRQARYGTVAPQYLPSELRYYGGTFDQYGSWNHHVEYGYVWYPRVRVGWRPYHHGRWDYIGPYGWTWIGYDPWAWPTHHFGRWGFATGAWFWIPARRWAPAWVSWAVAPGYVGWCPLGFNGRPLINLNVNFFGRGYRDPWRAWTVVRSRSFAPGVAVSRYALPATGIAQGAAFVTRRSAPIRPQLAATARRVPPIYSIGRDVAVPRGGGQLPAAVTAQPPVRLPSASASDPALRSRPSPSVGAGAGYPATAVPRGRDLGPGGPTPDAAAVGEAPVRGEPPTRRRSYDPGRIPSSPSDAPAYAPPPERARPRDGGVPLPGAVPSMPPTRLPSAPPPREYERRRGIGATGSDDAPRGAPYAPPPGRGPERAGPPPDRGPERAVPRGTTPGPPPGSGDRGGADRGGRRDPSGSSGGGAVPRRRPGQ